MSMGKQPGRIADTGHGWRLTGGVIGRTGRRRTTRMLIWAVAAVIVTALLASLVVATHSTAGSPTTVGVAVGDLAPNFTLSDLQGKQVSLARYRGHPVLVHFWAVDCTTCAAERPTYMRAIKDLGAHAPTILAVDAWGESRDYIASFVARVHEPGTVLVDPSHAVFDQYQGQGTPTAFYIDARGVIRQTVIGAESEDQIKANAALIGA